MSRANRAWQFHTPDMDSGSCVYYPLILLVLLFDRVCITL